MKLYDKIKESNINLRPLGIEWNNDELNYYCTPKNADVIGWAGVDGIHYCTIPEFGEIIFAVSPMNFGDCVHPIARNFEDLLRLLLSCADMAALEQCYTWDEDQFKTFLLDCPATNEQQAVLDQIREEYGLESIENAFAYIKKLQAEFDLSKIQYTDDYYDSDMNPAAPEPVEPWKVYFDGGYFGKRKPGNRPGQEMPLNARFTWNNEIWHIPAVYIFPKGIVVDFCVEVDPEQEKAFIEKWEPSKIAEEHPTRELRRQIDNENPLNIEFRPYLTVNENRLMPKSSTAISWIPASCLPSDVQNSKEAARIIKHYGLDDTRAWSFHRTVSLWNPAKKPKVKFMSLKLERDTVQIDGIHFKNPSIGDMIPFTHPVFRTEHKLTVLDYEQQELSFQSSVNPEYEFPTHHTAMTYTLEPDIPNKNFSVRDCIDNDEPKRKPNNSFEPQVTTDACAIGIIGGADGPTAIILSDRKKGTKTVPHAALSALHFEPQENIEWKIVFSEKLVDDIEVDLLP